jgi:uncharacterized membrane protein YkoI
MNRILVASIVVACASLSSSPASGQDASKWEKLLAETKVGLLDAAAKGAAAAGEGVVFHVELERDGAVVYSVDVARGAKSVNVLVGAAGGSIEQVEEEDEDHSAEARACKVGIPAAVSTALAQVPGRAVEAEMRLRAGRPVIEVKVVHEGRLALLEVDGSSGALAGASAAEPVFTETFRIEPGELASRGTNPYFVLEPGYVLYFEGIDEGQPATLTITVLDQTRNVAGVETRVVEERETLGGQVVEVSRNYFAISRRTNDVFYFGEEVDDYDDRQLVGHSGAWLVGEKGARFGLLIPGRPLLGARYYQEIAPGVAMDRAEVVELDATFVAPAGSFTGCLVTEETTPLESGRERKVYAPGVGLVKDGPLKLVRHGPGAK